MDSKKIYLEHLFDEIKAVSSEFQLSEGEEDVVILNPHQLNIFAESLLRSVNQFNKNEVYDEDNSIDYESEVVTDDDDDDFFDDDFLFDDDDDL